MKNSLDAIKERHQNRMLESQILDLKPDQRDQDISWLLAEVDHLAGEWCHENSGD